MLYTSTMNWVVETLNETVDKELEALEPSLKAKLRIAEMLEQLGPEKVKEPHVKPLEKKLWEIRMKGQSGIARAIYITVKEKRIVVFHAFVKKTQKTPRLAIELALKRLEELKKWQH